MRSNIKWVNFANRHIIKQFAAFFLDIRIQEIPCTSFLILLKLSFNFKYNNNIIIIIF